MKRTHLARVLALSLCLVFLLSACSWQRWFDLPFDLPFGGGAAESEEKQRRTVSYSDMEYERPDVDAMVARLGELTEGIRNAGSFDELWALDEEASDIAEHFETQLTLADIRRYQDVNDAFYKEEYRFCSESAAQLSNVANTLNLAIVDSPYASEYSDKVGEYVFATLKDQLRLNSPEVEGLRKQRNNLQADYNEDLTTLTVHYDGKSYTLAEVEQLEDAFLAYELSNQFNEEHAEHFAGLYAQLVALDKEIAGKLGFSSAAEMYYLSYNRDYGPDEALQFCEEVKTTIAPMVEDILLQSYGNVALSQDEVMAMMPNALGRIDPQLEDAFSDLQQYSLYDFDARDSKQSGIGFCTDLPAYDTAYIYGFWANDLRSATTLFHEFGHFFDSWLHWEDSSALTLDLAETYSQGLELLMQRYFSTFDRENSEGLVQSHLSDFVQSISYQPMLEEFQLHLFEEEDLSAENISALYTELLDEYGYGLFSPEGPDYSWVQITHIYDAPFYTISYASSAIVALQIWERSLDNWKAGAALYMDLMEADQSQPYTQLVESVGLRGPMDRTLLQDIADRFAEIYHLPAAAAAA